VVHASSSCCMLRSTSSHAHAHAHAHVHAPVALPVQEFYGHPPGVELGQRFAHRGEVWAAGIHQSYYMGIYHKWVCMRMLAGIRAGVQSKRHS
jgi:hypothetical protein